MSAANAKSSERWSATLPEGAGEPLGSEDARCRAVARLGPFAQRRQVDAEKSGPWGGPRNRMPLSEELAAEMIRQLAIAYNQLASADRGAPRIKNVVEELDEIEILSGEFAKKLRATNDVTRRLLQTAGSGLDNFLTIFPSELVEGADVSDLPAPGATEEELDQSGWIRALEALSQYANFARSTFLLTKGSPDPDTPDKGGNTNLLRESYGTATWKLANEGWHIFELFKPNTSSSTDGGLFHAFLLDVFEYATGLDPEDHAKLLNWIKHVVKVNRRAALLAKKRTRVNRRTTVNRRA
jgi:hypothetical protein